MFSRNLLILQSVGEQDPSDWITIQRRIERNAPDIEVRIAFDPLLDRDPIGRILYLRGLYDQ
jgi:hypothetical protein